MNVNALNALCLLTQELRKERPSVKLVNQHWFNLESYNWERYQSSGSHFPAAIQTHWCKLLMTIATSTMNPDENLSEHCDLLARFLSMNAWDKTRVNIWSLKDEWEDFVVYDHLKLMERHTHPMDHICFMEKWLDVEDQYRIYISDGESDRFGPLTKKLNTPAGFVVIA